MSISDFDRATDRWHDRQLHEHLDKEDEASSRGEFIDIYIHENMTNRILAWLDSAADGVLRECIAETGPKETNDETAAKMILNKEKGKVKVDFNFIDRNSI